MNPFIERSIIPRSATKVMRNGVGAMYSASAPERQRSQRRHRLSAVDQPNPSLLLVAMVDFGRLPSLRSPHDLSLE